MLLGDWNTSFYHISMLVRRKRNSISAIMSNNREWVHDEMVVKEVIWNGFSDLYTTSHRYSILDIPVGSTWQAPLSNEYHDRIDVGVSKEEIKAGLWSL